MADLAPLEIRALAKIIDELDYYQILHLEAGASAPEIKKAYYATSRTFHPDANKHLEAELFSDCVRIAKRVTEAYCVLRDPRRRQSYDQRLGGGDGLRIQLAEAKAAHAKQNSEERHGTTPQGRQFWQRAMQDCERGDLAAATRNLQTALSFEPGNQGFKEKLEEIKKQRQ